MTYRRFLLATSIAALASIVIVGPLDAQSRSSSNQRSFRQTYERMQREADARSRRMQEEGRERLRGRTCYNQNGSDNKDPYAQPTNIAGTTPTYCR